MTVNGVRRYSLRTRDGQQLHSDTITTLRLRRRAARGSSIDRFAHPIEPPCWQLRGVHGSTCSDLCWSLLLLVPSLAAAQAQADHAVGGVSRSLRAKWAGRGQRGARCRTARRTRRTSTAPSRSNFTQFNVALASQLTWLPLPSPAAGFTYRFDQGTGTFVRTSQSFGPILTDRAETIGRGRFSFGYNYQFFSFDQLEGIDLSRVPSVFTHDDFQLGGGRRDVVTTKQHHRCLGRAVDRRADLRPDGSARLLARGSDRQHASRSPFRPPPSSASAPGVAQHPFLRRSPRARGLWIREDVLGRRQCERHRRSDCPGERQRHPRRGQRPQRWPRRAHADWRRAEPARIGRRRRQAVHGASWTLKRMSPHINVAYQWNGSSVLAGDPETGEKADVPDQLLYAFGTDFGVSDRFSLTGDWLGRWAIDSPRVTSGRSRPRDRPWMTTSSSAGRRTRRRVRRWGSKRTSAAGC